MEKKKKFSTPVSDFCAESEFMVSTYVMQYEQDVFAMSIS